MDADPRAKRTGRGRRATPPAPRRAASSPRAVTPPLAAARPTPASPPSAAVSRARRATALAAASLAALFCVASHTQARAQDSAPASAAGGAVKLDEFGLIGHCDLGARLDNLAVALQNDPASEGYLVGYDPAKGSPGIARRAVEMQRHYMIYSRGIEEARVFAVAGGRHGGEGTKTELWIVPPGARPPFEARGAADEPPFSGKFATFWTEDDASFSQADEMDGPGSSWIARKAFADALKRQPKSKAYFVAYADDGRAPGAWRRFATSEKVRIEAEGVEPARLHVVNGGRRRQSQVELWIAAEDAPPPVKPKRREKPLREAERIGAYSRIGESDDGKERNWLLENFAEMLRADPQRVGVLVVFQDDAPARINEHDGELEESFDYAKLAGEWKQELAERYGVEAHRVVVRVGAAGEWHSRGIETWVVPRGSPLPEPAELVRLREAEMNAGDEPEEASPPGGAGRP
jgi:hypothetical protein